MKHSIRILVALGLLLSTAACSSGTSQQANLSAALYTADAGSYSARSSNDFFFQENN